MRAAVERRAVALFHLLRRIPGSLLLSSISLLLSFSLLSSLPLVADDLEAAVARMARVGASRSPSFSPDGKTLAFVSNLTGVPQVWTVPAAGGFPTLVTSFDDPVGGVEWSPDGKWIALATKKETLLTPHEGPGTYSGAFSPDGKTVRVSSNGGRDKLAFGRIALAADGAPGSIEIVAARDDAELASFAVDDAGTRAALLWNVAGRYELAFEDLLRKEMRAGPKLPGDVASGLTWSKDGQNLAMTISSATSPSDIFIFRESSPSSSFSSSSSFPPSFFKITDSPHPGVDLASLVSPQLLTFKAHDGEQLSGWLYRPKGSKGPGPIVLSFHGGPEGQEVPSFRADYQALVSRGIAVFAPNVRGSAGFGKRFVNLDNGALRANAVKDIVPVEYVLFPDEGHGFQKLPNRIRSTTAVVEWFSRWLGVNSVGPT